MFRSFQSSPVADYGLTAISPDGRLSPNAVTAVTT
jgi:hypothetical protein